MESNTTITIKKSMQQLLRFIGDTKLNKRATMNDILERVTEVYFKISHLDPPDFDKKEE